MLPPVSPELIAKNPQFATLYTRLTTESIDPHNGITRSLVKPEDTLEQDLRTYRAEFAKLRILQESLLKLTSQNTGLPEEIQDIVDIVATSYLRPTKLSKAHPELLNEDLDDFNESLPIIGQALSHFLTTQALTLTSLAFPEEAASTRNLSSKIDFLPGEIAHRRAVLSEKREEITSQRITLTNLATEVLTGYRKVLEKTIKLIEDVKFGSVEKAVRAQASCLALVVEGMEGKLKVMKYEALEAIYSPEALSALENYQHHLRDTQIRLQARQRTVEEELRRYDRAGSDMKGLVARYSAAMRSIETVTAEIKRLGENV